MCVCVCVCVLHGATATSEPGHLHYRGFTFTLRHTTLGRLFCPTQRPLPDNTQHSMHPAAFEPTIPASERPQTHALDRAAIGIASNSYILCLNCRLINSHFQVSSKYHNPKSTNNGLTYYNKDSHLKNSL